MAPRKRASTGASHAPKSATVSSWLRSNVESETLTDALARFPLVLLCNFLISAVGFSIASEFLAGDLGSIQRSGADWWEVAGWMSCKAFELLFVWVCGFDSIDLISLTLIAHYPINFLFNHFYRIRPSSVLASLLVDLVAAAVPFKLFRPALPSHTRDGAVANRFLIDDLPVRLLLTVIGAGLHAALLLVSYYTWVPGVLVQYFFPIPDVSAATKPNFPLMVVALAPLGLATRVFLFTPAAAAPSDARERGAPRFNPESATLSETAMHTFWSWSARSRELIKRALVAALLTFGYTFVQLYFTVRGVEAWGAGVWGLLWAVAGLMTAAVYGWAGRFEGPLVAE